MYFFERANVFTFAVLLNSSPQVKALLILTYLNTSPELLIKLVVSNLSVWEERYP